MPLRTALVGLATLLLLAGCNSSKERAKPPVRVSPEAKQAIQDNLTSLTDPVTMTIYRGDDNEYQGEETQALVDLMARTSTNVIVVPVDLTDEMRSELGVDHGPVIEMKGPAGGIMRYYGFPERREVSPFVDSVLLAAGRPFKLSPLVLSFLDGLEKEVVIRIFTTPE